tara:strand:- start:622 stop:1716 length:1095 start_codon:yes stop_codon:yes gene_type:complete
MKISIFNRLSKIYNIIKNIFGKTYSTIITGLFLCILRLLVGLFRILDNLFLPQTIKCKLQRPILIVGNPRSGTTFMHRYLVNNNFGVGSQLWQMLYPSIILQKILKPILPILEKFSPARHHSTAAHKTSLQSVETDDVALFFRYLDGFFLYGFILSWSEQNLYDWVDPKKRNTSYRDYNWLESIWLKNQFISKKNRTIGKLFSLSVNLPEFLIRFPDSKILYIIRDPLSVIPSGLSLVTGVLDKKFGFWNLPKSKRNHFINNLYNGLVQLLIRFEKDWSNNKIDRTKVKLIPFDRMMNDFDNLMLEIADFVDHKVSDELKINITKTAQKQKQFKSEHKYDLNKFGLTEKKILNDCKPIYNTFFN